MDFLLSNFNNISNAIGWTLIHFLWQGSVLFLCYWVITRIFFQNKVNFQYWIGITFIALCLIIPIREFVIQLGNSIDKSSPLKLLDGDAKRALRQWRFDPATISETNIKNRYQQIFSFNLDELEQCIGGSTGTRLATRRICNDI